MWAGNNHRAARPASMEPLFFKAENRLKKLLAGQLRFPLLQWSRFFSKRKISLLPALPDHPCLASMEPLFFKAENPLRAGDWPA